MNGDAVPFLDLIGPHVALEAELTAEFQSALRQAAFVGGPAVDAFESAFAGFCGVAHAIGVSSGTDALLLALRAAGVAAGDVVLTVPNTFIATTEAITQAGALPEFVDVQESTAQMDIALLEEHVSRSCAKDGQGRLTSRRSGRPVSAVVPVHLYGQMVDMDPLLALAGHFDLVVVEDACQAHGAEYYSRAAQRWIKAGAMGRASAFSFYPGKNLGACGEAGAVTTNDPAIAATVRQLRDHGQARKYHHDVEGYNARLDAIQASILRRKLAHLDDWNQARRRCAAEYRRLLDDVAGIRLFREPEWSRGVYHLFVAATERRDDLLDHLRAAGVGIGIHYPIPLHLQRAYQHLGYKCGDFPVAERLAEQVLSLPMYPQLTADQQLTVAREIKRARGSEELSE